MRRRFQYACGAALLGFIALARLPAQASGGQPIRIVAAENFYADIASQLGGERARVTAILSNPNSDPHSYEPTTDAASAVAAADIVIANGLGYDAFVPKLLAASPKDGRTVIDVGVLAGRRTGDNPHVWYSIPAMRRFAAALTAELTRRDRAHRQLFAANFQRFESSLRAWDAAVEAIRGAHAGASVLVTEPVFNDVLAAAGLTVRTPVPFQIAIEDGNDPSPQDVATMNGLLSSHDVKALVYNRQTIEPVTARLLAQAQVTRIPVVPVSETMPPGSHFQRWVLDETTALGQALGR